MSAIVKTKLKAARDAVSKKDYNKARDAASAALDYEPDNYMANVLLGVALLELGQADQSEQAYLKAVAGSPDQPLAWQGLTKLYEQSKNWDKYAESLEKLALLYVKADDATKCADVVKKLVQLRRDEGDSLQIADALSLFLPGSPYYPTLSALPPPDPTNPTGSAISYVQSAIHNSLPILEEIVAINEKQEATALQKEVDKRRMRLGSGGPEKIKLDVIRELFVDSKLPGLYQELLSHPNASDEMRRQAESKLLQHKQQLLFALPNSKEFSAQKKKLSAEVQELVSGMVLIQIPNELAWTLFIEAKDALSVEEYDLMVLTQFVRIFPDRPLSQIVAAYFTYHGIPLDEEDEEDAEKKRPAEDDEDYTSLILDLFPKAPGSLLAYRIAAEVYQLYEEYDNTIKVAEDGLELTLRQEQSQGIKLERVRRGFNVILANALVHFFPPKHHARARRIIDEVLEEDPDNIRCLMGRGYILQHERRWNDAATSFERVIELLPEDLEDGIRAEEELAWCRAQAADPDRGCKDLKDIVSRLDDLDGREQDQARCWWRLGRCHWDVGDPEEAYRSFITALKRQASFAPAFTCLGFYYADAASPPDPKRASKCFQKAFELDPREAEAARRLAEGFAEEREWDLVEVVARRTVEGEGGLEAGSDGAVATMYQPLNAWAWKAIGVVELNRGRYPAAIRALQIALRTDSEDALSWLRLGEAYSKAFRLAAALKALERARELDPFDWIASYFLAEVYRQMGQYQQAIDSFSEILEQQPTELRVLLSLAQTHLECGRAEQTLSFTRRAEASFLNAVDVVLNVVDNNPGFRRIAWKTAADALYELSRLAEVSEPELVTAVVSKVARLVASDHKGPADGLVPLNLNDVASPLSLLALAVHAYSYRISLGSLDDPSAASALYDLTISFVSYNQRLGAAANEKIGEEALRCLKEALGLDPLNDRYWHTLGDLYFTSRPKMAQHAYIKALEVDNKNFVTWTNLGLLYLHHGDVELANEAFYRAQVLNPDFSLAWIGQGLVATMNDHQQQAFSLFEHSVGLPGTTPFGDIAFARRLVDSLKSAPARDVSPESFIPAFFVLDRFARRCPQDPSALHLFGLVCERIGHTELAISVISQAITLLEAVYEETEDATVERQFTLAHANLGRVRLSVGEYDAAIASFETVTGLLAESTDETAVVPVVQAHLGAGLANFKLCAIQEAVQSFEAALERAADNPQLRGHAVVLLAQALWALDTPEAREAAKTQLLESIETDPENLAAITALGGMGILTADDGLVEAALSELLAAPLEQRLQRDPARDVPYLLAQHHLAQGDIDAAKAVVQKTVALEPARSRARWHLATLALQSGEPRAARGVLDGAAADASGDDDVRCALWLNAACDAADGDDAGALVVAQRAVKLAPWDRKAWLALALARADGV